LKDERSKSIIFNSSLVLKNRKNPPYLIPIVKKLFLHLNPREKSWVQKAISACVLTCEIWKIE